MVYSAAGLPLYLPQKTKKTVEAPQSDFDVANLLQAEDGMQSLLNAIELDLSQSRNDAPLSTDTTCSLHSSIVESPDHHDLMADLLGTNFMEADDAGISLETYDQNLGMGNCAGNNEHELSVMKLPNFADMNYDLNMDGLATTKRNWSGLPKHWDDKPLRDRRIRNCIASHMRAIMNPHLALASADNKLTRIRFACPVVAQKSYGHERRLFVPFPTCSIEGAYEKLCGRDPKAFLSISASGTHTAGLPEEAIFKADRQAQFRTIHISNETVGKAKSVRLKLQIAQENQQQPSDIPLLEIMTPEISLLTKPSKSANRMKLQSSFIHTNSAVSLFSRVNSQTARTRYLGLTQGQLSALPDLWTAFVIYEYRDGKVLQSEQVTPLTFGKIIVLRDTQSGYTSVPMVVRHINAKGSLVDADTNVSHMQKIVLERYIETKADTQIVPKVRSFLSAQDAHKAGAHKSEKAAETFMTSFEAAAESQAESGKSDWQVDEAGQWTMVGLSFYQTSFIDTLSEPPRAEELAVSMSAHPFHKDALSDNPVRTQDNNSNKRKFDDFSAASDLLSSVQVADSTSGQLRENTTSPTTTLDLRNSSVELDASGTHPDTLPSQLTIQTPLSPLPSLMAAPIYLQFPPRIQIHVKDYWQTSSCLVNSEVYLGPHGPCNILRIDQSPALFTDVTLEIQLPAREAVDGASELPLLFVREDGVVVLSGCHVYIPYIPA